MNKLNINDIDLEKIRAKYDYERDRRIRPDGINQYIEVTGDFSYFVEDPYIEDKIDREPLNDVKEVIIIGGGFGALLAGAHLRKAGMKDIRFIEKAGDFGGTWYWNRYPGVQCDIDATIYLPLLEETGFQPSLKYTFGDEIHEYTKVIAKHYDLYRDTCFQTEVTKITWLDKEQLWEVQTNRGDTMRTKYLLSASGPLHRPRLPAVPGINNFKGHTFHTTRWDYNYTGGNLHGGLDKLAGKRVAIVGTGATSLQCVPHLGASAEHLYVVQRTPSSVDARNNEARGPDWFKSLKSGWQDERIDNFDALTFGMPAKEDLIGDGWTDLAMSTMDLVKKLQDQGEYEVGSIDKLVEIADLQSMDRIRSRLDSVVKDPETAEMLKAYYRKWCKRPSFHDDYLKTFNRPNVTLLDTDGQGLTKISGNSIVTPDGKEHEVDCIIFATGFEVGTSYARRSGFEIYGRGGLTMTKKFENGPKTQFGLQTRDFPNMFFLGPLHAATGINVTQTLHEQAKTHAHIIKRTEEVGGKIVEPSLEIEKAWHEMIQNSGLAERREFLANCTPGFYNGDSGKDGKGARFEFEFASGAPDFYDIARTWRSVSHLPGSEVDGKALQPTSTDLAFMRSEKLIRTKLHYQTKKLLKQRDLAELPPIGAVSAEQLRNIFAQGAKMRGCGPELYNVSDKVINSEDNDLPIRIYTPSDNPKAIILYFHGGGGVVGSVETHDAPVRCLTKITNTIIVSVDYRLAPEAPFPAAVNDSVAALKWVSDNRKDIANENIPLFVCGDSSGGNLAAVVSLINHESLDVDIAGQILIYPSTDGKLDNPNFDAFESPVLKKEEILWLRGQYTPKQEDRNDPRVSPIDAKSHAYLPSALILTAEYDLLNPQAKAYAKKLEQADVQVQLKNFEGAVHGFFTDGVGLLQSNEAMADIAAFIDHKLVHLKDSKAFY